MATRDSWAQGNFGGMVIPSTGAWWGVDSVPSSYPSGYVAAFTSFETAFGRTSAIRSRHYGWNNGTPQWPYTGCEKADIAAGIVPMINWQGAGAFPVKRLGSSSTNNATVGGNQGIDRITFGEFDTQITTAAKALKALNGPIIFRLWMEMDGAHNPYNASWQYSGTETINDGVTAWKNAYNHVRSLFDAVGATLSTGGKVMFCFSTQSDSHTPSDWTVYWPGDSSVDLYGLDLYNHTFTGAQAFYDFANTHRKPFFISESGYKQGLSIADSGTNYDKDGSVTGHHMMAHLLAQMKTTHINCFAYVLWNGVGPNEDDRYTTTAASTADYKAFGADAWMASMPTFSGGGTTTAAPTTTRPGTTAPPTTTPVPGVVSVATSPSPAPQYYDPAWDGSTQTGKEKGRVNGVRRIGAICYVGGNYSHIIDVGGTLGGSGDRAQSYLSCFRRDTGADKTTWRPSLNGRVYGVTSDPTYSEVWVTGSFTGGVKVFAALTSATDGSAPTQPYTMPVVNGEVRKAVVHANDAWLVGPFNSIDGHTTVGLGKLKKVAGVWSVDTAFTAHVPTTDGGLPKDLVVKSDGSKVICSGQFTNLLYACDGATGAQDTSFAFQGAAITSTNHSLTMSANDTLVGFGFNDVFYCVDWNGSGPNHFSQSIAVGGSWNGYWYHTCDGNVQASCMAQLNEGAAFILGHHGDYAATAKNAATSTSSPSSHGVFAIPATAAGGNRFAFGNPNPQFLGDANSTPLKTFALSQDPFSYDVLQGGDEGLVNGSARRRFALFAGSGTGTPPPTTSPPPTSTAPPGYAMPDVVVSGQDLITRADNNPVYLRGYGVVGVPPSSLITKILNSGADLVRMSLSWDDMEPTAPTGSGTDFQTYRHTWASSYFTSLQNALQSLRTAGVYVIIDMCHQVNWSQFYSGNGVPSWYYTDSRFPGAQNVANGMDKSHSIWAWWNTDNNHDLYDAMISKVVGIGSQYSNVIGYELMNEPNPGSGGGLTKVNQTIAMHTWLAVHRDSVFSLDQNRAIVFGVRGGGQGVDSFDPTPYGGAVQMQNTNMMLDAHTYFTGLSPGVGANTAGEVGLGPTDAGSRNDDWYPDDNTTHNNLTTTDYVGTSANQEAVLLVYINKAASLGIPLMIGEWGVRNNDGNALVYQRQMFALLDQYGVHSTRWNLGADASPSHLGVFDTSGRYLPVANDATIVGGYPGGVNSWFGTAASTPAPTTPVPTTTMPPTTAAPTVNDTFTRTVATGIGTATSGQTWNILQGAASDYMVDGAKLVVDNTKGVIDLAAVGSAFDMDVVFKFKVTALPAGAGQFLSAAARVIDANNMWLAQIGIIPGAADTIALRRWVAGTNNVITAAVPLSIGDLLPNQWYWIHFQVAGSTGSARVWVDGNTEPTTWNITGIDPTDDGSTASASGFRNNLQSGATSTGLLHIDQFGLTQPVGVTTTPPPTTVATTTPPPTTIGTTVAPPPTTSPRATTAPPTTRPGTTVLPGAPVIVQAPDPVTLSRTATFNWTWQQPATTPSPTTAGPTTTATPTTTTAPPTTSSGGTTAPPTTTTPTTTVPPTTPSNLLVDTFTRTSSTDWGTANTGQAWSMTQGQSGQLETNGSRGLIHAVSGKSPNITAPVTVGDGGILFKAKILAATAGATQQIGPLIHYIDDNNYYRALIIYNTNGSSSLQISRKFNGTVTNLYGGGSGTTLGTAHAVGDDWWMRFEYQAGILYFKSWKDGTAEPGSWDQTYDDSVAVGASSAPGAGAMGIRSTCVAGNTSLSDFSVDSVNGYAGSVSGTTPPPTTTPTTAPPTTTPAGTTTTVHPTTAAPTTTAPPTTLGTDVTLIMIGDGSAPSHTNAAPVAARAATELQAATGPVYFLFLGDVYDFGDTTGWNNYNTLYGTAAPFDFTPYTIESIGNHEQSYLAARASYFGSSGAGHGSLTVTSPRYYHVMTSNGWDLVVLDPMANSTPPQNTGGPIADSYVDPNLPAQTTFFAGRMTANSGRKKIIISHHHYWNCFTDHGPDHSKYASSGAGYTTLLGHAWDSNGNPLARHILSGHVHSTQVHQERLLNGNVDTTKGIAQHIQAAGGVGFYTSRIASYSPAPLYENHSTFAFSKLVLKADGSSVLSVISSGGTVLFTKTYAA